MELSLSIIQRFKTFGLVDEYPSHGKEEDAIIEDLVAAVKISDVVMKAIEIPGAPVLSINTAMANELGYSTIEMEKAPLRKLRTILTEYEEKVGVNRKEKLLWFRELSDKVEAACKEMDAR